MRETDFVFSYFFFFPQLPLSVPLQLRGIPQKIETRVLQSEAEVSECKVNGKICCFWTKHFDENLTLG